jgi:hypothetical protein
MPDTLRLKGRFLFALISVSFVLLLPHRIFADSGTGITLCDISDVVYRADGAPAQGDVVILWSAFTTAAGQPVTAGSLTVTLGPNGQFNAALAPNSGAAPAGSYYRVTYKLNDGSTASEYWSVPASPTTTIGAIRSKLVPANQAAQFLTRDFADSHYIDLTDNQTVGGVKIFTSSPTVPAPVNPTDAASKAYVDSNTGATNLASPPPIGNVAPNTVSATALVAQNANGVLNAAAYPGSDTCAKMNAATTAALAAGVSHISAEGFSGPQTCTQTLNVGASIRYTLPAATWTLNGNPGIRFSGLASDAATLEGNGWHYGFQPSVVGTVLMSGVAAPLIENDSSSGVVIRNLELNGNSVGTFGYLGTYDGVNLENTHVHHFVFAGVVSTGNINHYFNNLINNNGSDGMVINTDAVLDGNNQISLNGGSGLHVLASGNKIVNLDSDHNTLHGVYFDGRVPADWTAGASYVAPTLIRPTAGNAGQFYYLSVTVNKASGTAAPTWNQSPGSLVADGQVQWLNIGTLPAQVQGNVMWNFLTGGLVDDNGAGEPSGFNADNVRLEGGLCSNNHVTGTQVSQAMVLNDAVTGIHWLNCANSTQSGVTWIGGGWNQENSDDVGGLIVENSNNISFDGFTSQDSAQNAVRLINSSRNSFTGINSYNTGNSNTSLVNSYGISIDGNSKNNTFTGIQIYATNPNSHGIYNRGSFNNIVSYVSGLLPSPPDDLQYARLFGGFDGYNSSPLNLLVGGQGMGLDNAGNALFSQGAAVSGDLSARDIPGHEYFVSKYGSIQAAINAAYNNGNVLGTVIDDRMTPYTGPGFIVYDSVVLKLAPTTYTINATVTYNNGNNNVTAGIIALPGAHVIGASPSSNHGTIVSPANGLNADLLATSTVGTGTATPQWWHWGEIANLRLVGNGSNQTAGECLKVENMGEVASVHDVELSACYSNNFESIGYAATQSAISNITSNRSVNGSGVAFTNLSGVALLNGVSGDCNQTSLVAANFNAAGTLTIHGLKAEAESSICTPQVQDPVILATTTDPTVLAAVKVDGGYAFGTTQHDFLKSNGPGSIQYEQENFYLNGYVNILNDTVRGQVLANAATATKQPVFYLSNGVVYGNQAFTLQGNTFVQGNPSGIPTEIFGMTSSSATLLADAGNGDNSSIVAGGIQVAGHNRTTFGQSPEAMARWGYRFLGPGSGYDTTKWDMVPAWNTGDTTEKNLGNPLTVCQKGGSVSCRWSNVYALNVDTTNFKLNGNSLATVASSGSYNDLSNKPAIPTQGAHLVAGTMQGATTQLTGSSADQTIYSATLPAGTFAVGQGAKCVARWTHSSTSSAVTYKWTLGSTTVAYGSLTSSSQNFDSEIEIYTISSLASEIINVSPIFGGTSILAGPSNNNGGAENLANADTIKLTFNMPSSDWVKGATFYCQTVQ